MDNTSVDDFELYLDWVITVLKTQDPLVIRNFKREAKTCLSAETLTQVLIAALQLLAETEPEAFYWALHHYDADFYVELRRQTAMDATQRLMQAGFYLGQDFSCLPGGGLLVTPEVKAALQDNQSAFRQFLLQKILHTLKKV